ncbi:hypothetical protein MSAN_00785900 [Mycena sanguinolenta]|uniref:Uncharacterized protein n=1 Tax=Mycena sanguinolenta TaxID=230812 RepID=A0A8H7DD63_9AGAR|nr:hypothetical protein MSAN_00785900 [Mycena sanguinolenta]
MPPKGVKRASPGADDAKNPLANVDLSDEDAQKTCKGPARPWAPRACHGSSDRIGQAKMMPAYEARRAIAKSIEKFWPVALMNHSHFAVFAQHNADQQALSYLEDLWIERNPVEPRCYTIEFHFKENPFFSNTVLKRSTSTMLPLVQQMISQMRMGSQRPCSTFRGSVTSNPSRLKSTGRTPKIGITIANEVFPDAIEFFLGQAGGDDEDLDSDDDDDDEAEEIDLEKPRSKKQKV